MAMAFAPTVAAKSQAEAILAEAQAAPPKLPTFKPRWWYKPNRLDARPVIWSLYNRPQDWEMSPGRAPDCYFTHKPSLHHFYANRFDAPSPVAKYRLSPTTTCGCSQTARRYQRFQKWFAARAFNHWRRTHWEPAHVAPAQRKVADQFAAHFVR